MEDSGHGIACHATWQLGDGSHLGTDCTLGGDAIDHHPSAGYPLSVC